MDIVPNNVSLSLFLSPSSSSFEALSAAAFLSLSLSLSVSLFLSQSRWHVVRLFPRARVSLRLRLSDTGFRSHHDRRSVTLSQARRGMPAWWRPGPWPPAVCMCVLLCFTVQYCTSPRNGNQANGNHFEICLSSSQKNRNSLTWVLAALTVCFTCPVLYRVSSESRLGAGEWEL